jgi:hypothetical protein
MVEFKPVHTYSINLGKCKGEYELYWSFDPTESGSKIPCRIKLKWGNVTLDTGFRGDSSYNDELISLGYSGVLSDATSGTLTLTKNEVNPTIAEVTIYTPLEESLVQTNLTCPAECVGAPTAPLFLEAGYLYSNGLGGYTTDLTGSPVGVNISWNEPENIGESPIQNYIIESSYENGAWTPIQTITSSQRSANILGLSGTISKYFFRVAGINVSGKGGFSIATAAPRRNQNCKNSIYYHVNDNINENSDVYTMGDYVAAYNIGSDDSVTINGVIFNGSNPPNNCIEGADGLVCLNITTTGSLKTDNSLNTNVLPFSGLSAEYRTLLSSAASSSATNLVLEITGLETGSQYLVQLWSNVSKQSGDISFGITQVTGLDIYGGNISLDLYHNLNYIEGGLGKSLIGTFNSCGTKLKLNLQGLDGLPPVANAIQIRKITTVACCRSSSALCTLHSPSTAVEECCEYDSYQGEYDCNGFRIMANCWMCPSFYG